MRHMRETIEADHLPDYALMLDEDQAVFLRRAGGGIGANRASVPCITAARDVEDGADLLKAVAPAAAPERRIIVSSKAIERLHEMAPRWDKYALEHAYVAWAKDKDPARDEDARFLGWVKSYTKNKAAP